MMCVMSRCRHLLDAVLLFFFLSCSSSRMGRYRYRYSLNKYPAGCCDDYTYVIVNLCNSVCNLMVDDDDDDNSVPASELIE